MPRKPLTSSAVREPLAWALGAPARVAALRVLAGAGEPLTQREVARRAGVQHRSIQLALDDLVALGVSARQAGGRDYLVTLNTRHRLAPAIQTLFAAEATHFLDLRRRLTGVAEASAPRSGLLAVALFGSMARARDVPGSDCDILLVARSVAGAGVAIDDFSAAAGAIQQTVGCRIAPVAYGRADAGRRWRARTPPFGDIRRDAIVVFGPPLEQVLGARHATGRPAR